MATESVAITVIIAIVTIITVRINIIIQNQHLYESKLRVSHLITPIILRYMIPYITPLRSLDYSSYNPLTPNPKLKIEVSASFPLSLYTPNFTVYPIQCLCNPYNVACALMSWLAVRLEASAYDRGLNDYQY